MMKLLAISDTYIPAEFMRRGLAPLTEFGVEVDVYGWEHDELTQLQEANLKIEQAGPDAVALPPDLMTTVADYEILVTQFAPVGRELFDAAAALRVVGVLRTGTENIDIRFATDRGIAVLNTPGRNARAVAECTIGLILAEVRNIARAHAALKDGRWQRAFPNSDAIPELNEKTVGLIGFGAVGRLVAHYLKAFGSRIVVFDPYFEGDPAPAELVELPTLLAEADIVSLHARLTAESHHLIGAEQLGRMKRSAILVNTARSGLVDEEALIHALKNRTIMGAAIDVYDSEPIGRDHPLIGLDNVTVVPHLAGSTIDAFRQSPRLMGGHLARMLSGEEDLPIVNGIQPRFEVLSRPPQQSETRTRQNR